MPKSAERVMRILERCRSSKTGLRNVEIAEMLNIPTSSLSILLSSMVKNGYLTLNPEGKRYVLGPQVLVLASYYLSNLDIIEIGYPILKRIVASTDEAASISIRKGNESLCVCKVDSSQPLTRLVVVGSCSPLHASAAGKNFLAHASSGELDRYLSTVELRPYTPKTITDPKRLVTELKRVRKNGYAKNDEELHESVVAFATPVFDVYGSVAATINLAFPTMRCNAVKEKQVVGILMEAAANLSQKLGYNPY